MCSVYFIYVYCPEIRPVQQSVWWEHKTKDLKNNTMVPVPCYTTSQTQSKEYMVRDWDQGSETCLTYSGNYVNQVKLEADPNAVIMITNVKEEAYPTLWRDWLPGVFEGNLIQHFFVFVFFLFSEKKKKKRKNKKKYLVFI